MSTIELQSQSSVRQRRLTAILEICGVYMVGQLIAFIFMKLLGVEVQNPITVLQANPNADLLEMSKNLASILLLQYGGIMFLALTIGWWHRKRRISEYGVTTARQPILKQVWIGVVLFAVAQLPVKLLIAIDHVIPLGAKAVTQNIASMLDWSDFKFWVFMAVGSFLLIPLVEEFFYRGYVQVRLGEDFDAPTAILVTALFFEFSHGQYYLTLSPWTVGMLLTGVFSSLAWGYIFYRTRSLIAPIVAHVLINFPVRGMADFLVPIAMFVIVVIYRKQIVEAFSAFGAMFKSDILSKIGTALASIFMILFAVIVATAEDIAILFSIVALVIALVLEFMDKRETKQNEKLAGELS
jgi:membrane protease YdiL (CAAX protease family)